MDQKNHNQKKVTSVAYIYFWGYGPFHRYIHFDICDKEDFKKFIFLTFNNPSGYVLMF